MSGPGSSLGLGHCVVFLGKTLNCLYRLPGVPANLMLGVTLRWTSIPSRGNGLLPGASRNTLSHFMLVARGEALGSYVDKKNKKNKKTLLNGDVDPAKQTWKGSRVGIYLSTSSYRVGK